MSVLKKLIEHSIVNTEDSLVEAVSFLHDAITTRKTDSLDSVFEFMHSTSSDVVSDVFEGSMNFLCSSAGVSGLFPPSDWQCIAINTYFTAPPDFRLMQIDVAAALELPMSEVYVHPKLMSTGEAFKMSPLEALNYCSMVKSKAKGDSFKYMNELKASAPPNSEDACKGKEWVVLVAVRRALRKEEASLEEAIHSLSEYFIETEDNFPHKVIAVASPWTGFGHFLYEKHSYELFGELLNAKNEANAEDFGLACGYVVTPQGEELRITLLDDESNFIAGFRIRNIQEPELMVLKLDELLEANGNLPVTEVIKRENSKAMDEGSLISFFIPGSGWTQVQSG